MTPELSIILPIRQFDNILRKCITSLNNQTFSNFEVIVTETTGDSYAADISRKLHLAEEQLRILPPQKSNRFWDILSASVKNARGKYVLFLNPRQWLKNDTAERLVARMNESGADMVEMRMTKYISGLKIKDTSTDEAVPSDTLINGEQLRELASFIGNGSFITTSITDKIYRRDLLQEALAVNFPGEEFCDEILNINYLRNARSVLILSYSGVNFNWQDTLTDYRFSALEDAKHAYMFKKVCGQDLPLITQELHDRLNRHISALTLEQGWTRQATIYFLERELRNPVWKEIGVTETAEELMPSMAAKPLKESIADLLKKLLS